MRVSGKLLARREQVNATSLNTRSKQHNEAYDAASGSVEVAGRPEAPWLEGIGIRVWHVLCAACRRGALVAKINLSHGGPPIVQRRILYNTQGYLF